MGRWSRTGGTANAFSWVPMACMCVATAHRRDSTHSTPLLQQERGGLSSPRMASSAPSPPQFHRISPVCEGRPQRRRLCCAAAGTPPSCVHHSDVERRPLRPRPARLQAQSPRPRAPKTRLQPPRSQQQPASRWRRRGGRQAQLGARACSEESAASPRLPAPAPASSAT